MHDVGADGVEGYTFLGEVDAVGAGEAYDGAGFWSDCCCSEWGWVIVYCFAAV